jgi:hypothetical protein
MHLPRMVLSHPAGVNGGMHSKRFVADLNDWGFTRDEATEILCMIFGLSRGAARLYLVTHPAWAAENASDDSNGSTGGETATPSRN